MKNVNRYRFLFAGGGTGGHLFPAIAVAQQIRASVPECDILFVGTKKKIEGRVVPQMGFKFSSIWIKGFARKFTLENFLFPLKLFVSLIQSFIINFKFKPTVSIGSGGYVAGPALWMAKILGSKIVLLEQNSFPGKTTKLLEKHAEQIHLSFENSIKYFANKNKCYVTGNPIRIDIALTDKSTASQKLNLDVNKKTIAIVGGSLGAKSINEAIESLIELFQKENIQLIWQTGSTYYEKNSKYESKTVKLFSFIEDIASVYSAADLVIARAGATTIAEITTLGLASLLIPSPNVAENHQYFNAKSLVDENAAILLEDRDLKSDFANTVLELIKNDSLLIELKKNSKKLGKPLAAEEIAKQVIALAEKN